MDLAPVVNKFATISISESTYYEEEQLQFPASSAIRKDKGVEDSTLIETLVIYKKSNIILGKIAKNYLPRTIDNTFLIYANIEKISFTIGDSVIRIDGNDTIIIDKK